MKQFLVFGVYYQLLKGKTTAKQIANHYEVSPRTVYRYINALSEAGVPIITKQGKYGGIYIKSDFSLESFANELANK